MITAGMFVLLVFGSAAFGFLLGKTRAGRRALALAGEHLQLPGAHPYRFPAEASPGDVQQEKTHWAEPLPRPIHVGPMDHCPACGARNGTHCGICGYVGPEAKTADTGNRIHACSGPVEARVLVAKINVSVPVFCSDARRRDGGCTKAFSHTHQLCTACGAEWICGIVSPMHEARDA